jgi:two-component sensor histidine kinase
MAETLVLIVSELVTNAVVHAGCPAVLKILLCGTPDAAPAHDVPGRRTPARGVREATAASGRTDPTAGPEPALAPRITVRCVRVEVADNCARPPRPRQVDTDETCGRGLALVDGLADRWGWEPSGAGKRIWCELDRSTPASGAPRTVYGHHTAYEDMAAYEAV